MAPSTSLVELVVKMLAPYVGENMARAAVNGQRGKLGFSPADLTSAELDPLLDALSPGLAVFVGRAKVGDIVTEIRRAARETV